MGQKIACDQFFSWISTFHYRAIIERLWDFWKIQSCMIISTQCDLGITKAIFINKYFHKYLSEKRSSEIHLQLSCKYFANLCQQCFSKGTPGINGLTDFWLILTDFVWWFQPKESINYKITEGELFISILSTTLLQIVSKLMSHSKVIFKSMTGPDDTGQVDL